jgi:Uma2 family endonuclease
MSLLVPPLIPEVGPLPDLPKGYELVDGELVELQGGCECGFIAGKLACLLGNHCERPWIGWALGREAGYQLLPARPKLIRKPNVSFVRLGRLPNEELPYGPARLAPDLAVEVVSPNSLSYEVETKVAEYREAGVPLLWVVAPPTRRVLIRRDGSVREVGEDGELSGEDVVPGFRCHVADLFPPTLEPTDVCRPTTGPTDEQRGPGGQTMNLLAAEPTDSLPDLPDGFELVDGKLVEKQMGAEATYIGTMLSHLLISHCPSPPNNGWVFGADASYQFIRARPTLVRKPDVSFVRPGRFPGERPPQGHIRLAPDLAVEVVSPNDLSDEVETKVAEYREAGVPLLWVVAPPTRRVLIRRRRGSVHEVGEDGELSGEDVIPGFRCRVTDLFLPPPEPGENGATA